MDTKFTVVRPKYTCIHFNRPAIILDIEKYNMRDVDPDIWLFGIVPNLHQSSKCEKDQRDLQNRTTLRPVWLLPHGSRRLIQYQSNQV